MKIVSTCWRMRLGGKMNENLLALKEVLNILNEIKKRRPENE